MSDGRRDMTAPSRAQLERSLSVAESRLDALTAERHELANAIADHWRPRVTSLEETNRSLRQRLEAFEARALDLVNQLNDANSDEAQQIAQLTADLATERAAREKAEHYNAAGDVALFKMQSERDAALARVTHLQSEIRAHRQAHQETSRECEAAESALASVREWADRFERDVPKAELMRRLSSAPSPAPCSGCYSTESEWPEGWRWYRNAGHNGEPYLAHLSADLELTLTNLRAMLRFHGLLIVPANQPCSGCAAAGELMKRATRFGGCTQKWIDAYDAWLKDHPDPAQAPSNPTGTGPVLMMLDEDDPAEASRQETGDW